MATCAKVSFSAEPGRADKVTSRNAKFSESSLSFVTHLHLLPERIAVNAARSQSVQRIFDISSIHDFLRAYVAGIRLIKKNHAFAEKSFAKWMRENDPEITRKTVESYAHLFKTAPFVPDKGIENVIQDLVKARPDFKEYIGWPEPFRENGPLEKVLKEK